MRQGVKILKSTLGHATADILRDRILYGEYEQGSRISEEEIAKEFDISRASVRDALFLLETEGLVVREINKYKLIRKFTPKEVIDLLHMRAALEIAAATECVNNNTIPEEELRHYLKIMKNTLLLETDDNWDDLVISDFKFHDSIVNASNNSYYQRFWLDVRSQCLMLMNKTFRISSKDYICGIDDHEVYIELMKSGNLIEMSRHILDTCMATSEFLVNS